MDDHGFIDRESFERIARQVRQAERAPQADGREPAPEIFEGGGGSGFLGILNEQLTFRGSAEVSIYAGAHPLHDSGVDRTAYDWFLHEDGDLLTAGTRVHLTGIAGRLYVVNADCPPEA